MKLIPYKSITNAIALLFSGCILLTACSKDDEEEVVTDSNPLKLEASNTQVALDADKPDKEILAFMWEPAPDRSAEGTILKRYLFKMDLAGKSFETAIPSATISQGRYYKTFTSRELNDILLNHWEVSLGTEVGIEARIIAQYEHPDRFITPLVSTISLRIQSVRLESTPLYFTGSATPAGSNLADAIEMTEVLPSETYVWRGELVPGEFFFALQRDNDYPAYKKGDNAEGTSLVYQASAAEPGVPFQIEKAGRYAVSVNLTTRKIACVEVFYADRLSIVGSGTNWGWPSGSVGPDDAAYGGWMTWSATNPHECEITTELKAGEFRICITGQSDAAFRPYNAAAPVTTEEQDVVFMSKPDYKWKLEAANAGTYQIILDTRNYKIKIIKK